jgi:dGTPase
MTDRYDRFHQVDELKLKDRRSPGRRDRDRILYSTAFRRLAGITQVITATDRFPVHNRLTHSLEVAQIGRSLAEELLRDHEEFVGLGEAPDPDVVEAACLAHDLGHPPFGHVAEEELNRLVTDYRRSAQGFEGNAQSFRVVAKLATRRLGIGGLDLTRATLCALLKYPWLRNKAGQKSARKWGAYDSEEPELEFARALLPGAQPEARSLEADLMDWADDVAYAIHDVEDFYRAGIVPLGRLAYDSDERLSFIEAATARNDLLSAYDSSDLESALVRVFGVAPIPDPYVGNRQDRALLRTVTSHLIDGYVNAVTLESNQDGLTLRIDPEALMEVTLLKGITWHYVIESRALLAQRYGQKNLINALFMTLCDAASTTNDRLIFPEFFRELMGSSPDDALITRTVADFISSMTESQVIDLHHRLTGISLGAALDPIVT